jgi:hypothetical protein
MSDVLTRVRHLIALTASSSENEARNAAVLAIRLIARHGLVISLPAHPPSAKAARRRSSASKRAVPNPTERIVSPLGGDCIGCGERYRSGQIVYWFASGSGMHPACYQRWTSGQ